MTWLTQFLIYIFFWWLTLFAILPIGIRRAENPEIGQDPGAPTNPRLKMRILVTSLIASIIWGAYFLVTHVFGITFFYIFNR